MPLFTRVAPKAPLPDEPQLPQVPERTWMLMRGIILVFLGCCLNVMTFEYLIRTDAESGNLITFAQFVTATVVEGLSSQIDFQRWRLKPTAVPIDVYIKMVMLHWTLSVVNNYVLGWNIPVPLHMVFRAGSPVSTLLLGFLLLGKRYTIREVLSVFLVTMGILLATLSSATLKEGSLLGDGDFYFWCGIAMLTGTLFLAALLGTYQERVFVEYGKKTAECLFYTHALSLPLMLIILPDVIKHAAVYSASPALPGAPAIPAAWAALAANVALQYVCVRGVYYCVGYSSALTSTLILTTRKFVSLIISVFYFRNPWTPLHWLATAILFGGLVLYSWPKQNAKSS